jgi:hypothetical protein
VIKEKGLNIDEGVGWPFNGEKLIRLGDLLDYTAQGTREVFRDYCLRHNKDWYGYNVAHFWDQVIPPMIEAVDPTGESYYDDTPLMKTVFRMIKAPMLPDHLPSQENQNKFIDWIERYYSQNKKTPGILAIKEQLETLGFGVRESYPSRPDPDAATYWPEDFSPSQYEI